MTDSIVIASVKSPLTLTISEIKGESFYVSIDSPFLSASRGVYSYPDPKGISNLLQEIASNEKPWEGEVIWESLEGEFRLGALCSSLGSVTFAIRLRQFSGEEDWNVETELVSELGQLPKIATDARRLFEEIADATSADLIV
jgi:hypothetical protein